MKYEVQLRENRGFFEHVDGTFTKFSCRLQTPLARSEHLLYLDASSCALNEEPQQRSRIQGTLLTVQRDDCCVELPNDLYQLFSEILERLSMKYVSSLVDDNTSTGKVVVMSFDNEDCATFLRANVFSAVGSLVVSLSKVAGNSDNTPDSFCKHFNNVFVPAIRQTLFSAMDSLDKRPVSIDKRKELLLQEVQQHLQSSVLFQRLFEVKQQPDFEDVAMVLSEYAYKKTKDAKRL